MNKSSPQATSIKIPKHWLHIGTDELRDDLFRPVINNPFMNKANGGLWASPFRLQEGHYSDWHEFATRELLSRREVKNGVVFTFKKNTRIFVIDTQDDLIELIDEVGTARNPFPIKAFKSIDFENAKNYYDVIYLTEAGQWRTRMPFDRMEYNLYGWDVECCYILNPNVIDHQQPVRL